MLDACALLTIPVVPGLVQVIEPLGCLSHVLQQLRAGDTSSSLRDALPETVEKCLVSQFHGDDQAVGDSPGPECCQEVGMADPLDNFECPQFGVADCTPEGDEFQCYRKPTRTNGFPDFPEASFPTLANQLVSGYGLGRDVSWKHVTWKHVTWP